MILETPKGLTESLSYSRILEAPKRLNVTYSAPKSESVCEVYEGLEQKSSGLKA